jgi:ELWxxDGT repeat protein
MNGVELWKTDGTAAGTALVMDINTGAKKGSFPQGLTVFNGELYFSADDSVNGRELWKTDGTDPGTMLVKNINVSQGGKAASNPEALTVFNGELYFSADDGNGVGLWKIDGVADPVLVTVNGTGDSNPAEFTVFDGALYFSADDGMNGAELWKTDGTAEPVLVKDINTVTVDSNPAELTVSNGVLYFRADDGVNGRELWKSDGTVAGTVLVKDIYPMGESLPEELTPF